MPDVITDIAKVTRSHIPTTNVLVRLEVPNKGHIATERDAAITLSGGVVEAVAPQRKRGMPLGSTDTHPKKKRGTKAQTDPLIINVEKPSHEIVSDYNYVHESILGDTPNIKMVSENKEISMNYEKAYKLMEKSSMHIDNILTYTVAQEIIEHDDVEPRSIVECQQRAD